MSDHWMRAAGRNGIPSAFIVGKTGNVEWMGHPGSMDAPLKAIIAGTFDREAFAKQEALDRKWRKDRRQIQTEMAIAREKGDNAEVFRIVNEASAEYPDVPWLQRERYRLMMQFSKDASEVRVYGKTIAKKNWDDPQFLNAISWWTVDDKLARHRDLDGALAWAKRADELTEHKDPQIIDTLARCWWERGDTVQAIETQRKAVSLAEGDLKAQLEATLSEYIRDSKAA